MRNSQHYYAIPHEGSQTPPELFERVMARAQDPAARPCRPEWMNFDFIDKCYEVEEQIYDPEILRDELTKQIEALRMRFHQQEFAAEMRRDYDFVIWATYGLGPSRGLFQSVKYQVAEKILIQLPKQLQQFRWWSSTGRLRPSILTAAPSAPCGARPSTPITGPQPIPNEPIPEQYRSC